MKWSKLKNDIEKILKDKSLSDINITISLDPLDTDPEVGIRYFGDILETMDSLGEIVLISDGELDNS